MSSVVKGFGGETVPCLRVADLLIRCWWDSEESGTSPETAGRLLALHSDPANGFIAFDLEVNKMLE